MMDYNSMMALKDLVAGEEEEAEIVSNPNKGSMLNPGAIGGGEKKEIAKPNAKIQAKIGEKYQPKGRKAVAEEEQALKKPSVDKKHQIWSEEEVAELPVSRDDPRRQPQFQTFYRQKVGAEDVFLGLSERDPSSNCCQQVTYRIELPGAVLKEVQIDLNERQMVVQSKQFYLMQHFQYRTQPKKAKAKFIADKDVLQLILPILRNDDF